MTMLTKNRPRRRFTKTPCVRCGGTDRYPSGSCKACIKASNERRAREQPERVRALVNQRQRRHMARLSADEKRARNRAANHKKSLKTFGLTAEQYDAMNHAQGGVCAICKQPPNGRGPHLHIDHDHSSGKVRALLCMNCNTAIGLLGDDPSRLQAVIDYLNKHGKDNHVMKQFTITLAA